MTVTSLSSWPFIAAINLGPPQLVEWGELLVEINFFGHEIASFTINLQALQRVKKIDRGLSSKIRIRRCTPRSSDLRVTFRPVD